MPVKWILYHHLIYLWHHSPEWSVFTSTFGASSCFPSSFLLYSLNIILITALLVSLSIISSCFLLSVDYMCLNYCNFASLILSVIHISTNIPNLVKLQKHTYCGRIESMTNRWSFFVCCWISSESAESWLTNIAIISENILRDRVRVSPMANKNKNKKPLNPMNYNTGT